MGKVAKTLSQEVVNLSNEMKLKVHITENYEMLHVINFASRSKSIQLIECEIIRKE